MHRDRRSCRLLRDEGEPIWVFAVLRHITIEIYSMGSDGLSSLVIRMEHPLLYLAKLSGVCCGLYCFYDDLRAFVVNPSTRESVSFRKPGMRAASSGARPDADFVELGFYPPTQEYKLVRLSGDANRELSLQSNLPVYDLACEVLTLGAAGGSSDDSWKRSGGGRPVSYPISAGSTCAGGTLFWVFHMKAYMSPSEGIVAFDLGKDEFTVVPPPPGVLMGAGDYPGYLVELRGRLCFVPQPDSATGDIVIWSLKEAARGDRPGGGGRVWVEEHRIRRAPFLRGVSVYPICFQNGKILLSSQRDVVSQLRQLVLYSLHPRTFATVKDISPRPLDGRWSSSYNGGLTSIHAFEETLMPLKN